MLLKTVKVSSKGQITLPAEVLRALKAGKGDEFVLIQEGHRITLVPAERVAKLVDDDLGGFENLAVPSFEDLWDNPEDEVWDDA